MKVIQNSLLYNKIECYNKGAQRLLLIERLQSLLKILKIHKVRPLDCGHE